MLCICRPQTSITDPIRHGADPTGARDSYDAFLRAEAACPIGGTFWVPPGTYALSRKFRFNPFRARFQGDGLIIPHESNASGDYLIEFFNQGADPGILNLALNCHIDRVMVDCKFSNRGIYFGQLYNSTIVGARVWNAYGTAICIDNCFENSWFGPLIANSKRRQASWTATAWNSGTSYTVGQRVFRDYAAYNPVTSYIANNLAVYSTKLYRCLIPATNKQPDLNPTYWQPIPFEYFECMIAHSNKDPHAGGFTTNAVTVGDRYWKQVYLEEAALDINCTYGDEVVDNEYIYGLQMRHNDHKVMIRIDNAQNQRKVTNVSFYGGQIHAIIQAYLDAFPQTGQTLADDGVLMQIGHSMRCRIMGLTVRSAEAARVTHFQLGHINPDKKNEENFISKCDLSGEGSSTYGISIMPGLTTGLAARIQDNIYSFTDAATSPRQAGDTARVVDFSTNRDMVAASVPANFSATHQFRIVDASGNVYFVPCSNALW